MQLGATAHGADACLRAPVSMASWGQWMTSDDSSGQRVVRSARPAPSGGLAVMPGRWQRPHRPLVDRGDERTAIDGLLESVRLGLSAVLVLRGSQGAGKTTLLD